MDCLIHALESSLVGFKWVQTRLANQVYGPLVRLIGMILGMIGMPRISLGIRTIEGINLWIVGLPRTIWILAQ